MARCGRQHVQHHIDLEELESGWFHNRHSDQMVLAQFDLKLLEQFRLIWMEV